MELPKDTAAKAEKFSELSAERKQQIISHLAETREDRGNETITVLIGNGGPEGRFVATIFGKPLPAKSDSPQNKSVGAPETK